MTMMRYYAVRASFQWMISLFLFVAAHTASSEENVSTNPEKSKPAVLSNQWIHVEIDSLKGGGIHQFTAHQGKILYPQGTGASHSTVQPGMSLQLFKKLPHSIENVTTGMTYPLPEKYESELIQEASGTILRLTSGDTSPLSVERIYHLTAMESVCHVTTTIANRGTSNLTFYPSEIVSFDASIGRDRLPNMMTYFYAPYTSLQNNGAAFFQVRGVSNEKQYNVMPQEKIFITRYMSSSGEVKLSNAKHWYAIQNLIGSRDIHGGTVCAIEYDFPDGTPVSVPDNQMIYVNGISETVSGSTTPVQLDPFIQSAYVLGRVELKPGQVFRYISHWTAVCCAGPIVDVKNRIVFNKHLEVLLAPDNGAFVNLANMGIPEEGRIGFQFYHENGEIRKIEDGKGGMKEQLLIVPIASPLRPCEVVPYLQTPFAMITWAFAADDLRSEDDTFAKLMRDQVHSIRMMLVNEERQTMRELDRVYGPFSNYDKPLY